MSQEVLTGYIGKFCLVYLDDIIIYSNDYDEHFRHLALVLSAKAEYNFSHPGWMNERQLTAQGDTPVKTRLYFLSVLEWTVKPGYLAKAE